MDQPQRGRVFQNQKVITKQMAEGPVAEVSGNPEGSQGQVEAEWERGVLEDSPQALALFQESRQCPGPVSRLHPLDLGKSVLLAGPSRGGSGTSTS